LPAAAAGDEGGSTDIPTPPLTAEVATASSITATVLVSSTTVASVTSTPTTAGAETATATGTTAAITTATSSATAALTGTATVASAPATAGDGMHKGTISGFDQQTVYIWEGGTLLALPLGPASALTLAGKPITVWRLAIRESVTAQVSGGQVITLAAQPLPAAPTATATAVRTTHAMARAQNAAAMPVNTSGADTWTQTNGSFMGVYGLVVDPNNPNHLWIGSNTVLYEGERANGTVIWTPRSGGAVWMGEDAVTSGKLYRSDGDVDVSLDGGQTW